MIANSFRTAATSKDRWNIAGILHGINELKFEAILHERNANSAGRFKNIAPIVCELIVSVTKGYKTKYRLINESLEYADKARKEINGLIARVRNYVKNCISAS